LERDRAAVLTLRSAVRGVIDYRHAELHNPMWWKRWRYLIQAMEDESYETLLQTAYKFQLALVSNSKISSEDFSKVQKSAKELFSDIEGHLRPWLVHERALQQKDQYATFKEQWKQAVGFDPSDKTALADWEAKVKKVMEVANSSRADKENAAQQESRIAAKIEEIRQKRLKQQGRK